jgi:hypothetical protein
MVEALLNDVEGMLASHASRTLTVVEISEEKPELWCGATRKLGTRLSQAAPTGVTNRGQHLGLRCYIRWPNGGELGQQGEPRFLMIQVDDDGVKSTDVLPLSQIGHSLPIDCASG